METFGFLTHFEDFDTNASRGEFIFLQVDPLQVGDPVEGLGWDAADVVACTFDELQSVCT